jgi:hypothetical protein
MLPHYQFPILPLYRFLMDRELATVPESGAQGGAEEIVMFLALPGLQIGLRHARIEIVSILKAKLRGVEDRGVIPGQGVLTYVGKFQGIPDARLPDKAIRGEAPIPARWPRSGRADR